MAEEPKLNREQKRLLQRRGQLSAEGTPVATRERAAPKVAAPKVTPRQYLGEVRSEMGKVAWPTRAETVNYSTVVLITLVVLVAAIFGIDYVMARGALFLFK